MRSAKRKYSILLILSIVIFGSVFCTNSEIAVENQIAIETAVVPYPTYTPQPTYTPYPTYTPVPRPKPQVRIKAVQETATPVNFSDAKIAAKACIDIKRKYAAAWYELGIAEKNLGNKAAAKIAFKEASKDRKWKE